MCASLRILNPVIESADDNPHVLMLCRDGRHQQIDGSGPRGGTRCRVTGLAMTGNRVGQIAGVPGVDSGIGRDAGIPFEAGNRKGPPPILSTMRRR